MKASIIFLAGALALAIAGMPAAAGARADHGLRFADLEFAMPEDPLLPQSDPRWTQHHTPPSQLARALAALRNAVPPGTSADAASRILRKAGARCMDAGAAQMDCRYHDVQTPYNYVDPVEWTVTLALADGRVAGLSVARDWSRHR